MQYVQLRHQIAHAQYDEGRGKWCLKIRRSVSNGTTDEFEEFEDTADVVISGAGALSRWTWPDIDGLQTFKGKLIHSADWDMRGEKTWQDSVKDWNDKKIGLIGVASPIHVYLVYSLRACSAHDKLHRVHRRYKSFRSCSRESAL